VSLVILGPTFSYTLAMAENMDGIKPKLDMLVLSLKIIDFLDIYCGSFS